MRNTISNINSMILNLISEFDGLKQIYSKADQY